MAQVIVPDSPAFEAMQLVLVVLVLLFQLGIKLLPAGLYCGEHCSLLITTQCISQKLLLEASILIVAFLMLLTMDTNELNQFLADMELVIFQQLN